MRKLSAQQLLSKTARSATFVIHVASTTGSRGWCCLFLEKAHVIGEWKSGNDISSLIQSGSECGRLRRCFLNSTFLADHTKTFQKHSILVAQKLQSTKGARRECKKKKVMWFKMALYYMDLALDCPDLHSIRVNCFWKNITDAAYRI